MSKRHKDRNTENHKRGRNKVVVVVFFKTVARKHIQEFSKVFNYREFCLQGYSGNIILQALPWLEIPKGACQASRVLCLLSTTTPPFVPLQLEFTSSNSADDIAEPSVNESGKSWACRELQRCEDCGIGLLTQSL